MGLFREGNTFLLHRGGCPEDIVVTDVLLPDLVGHDHRPAAFLVYLWQAAEVAKSTKHRQLAGTVQVSFGALAEAAGISKSSAQAAVRRRLRRRLLPVSKLNATAVPQYTVLTPWANRLPRDR